MYILLVVVIVTLILILAYIVKKVFEVPPKKALLDETKMIEFELETNKGVFRGKLRYKAPKRI